MKQNKSPSAEKTETYSLDEKNVLVAFSNYSGFQNFSLKKRVEVFSSVDYPVPVGTLKHWRANYKKYGSAEAPLGNRGRAALLDDVEEDIFSGMILQAANDGRNLRQVDMKGFIEKEFGYSCDQHTAGEYARRLGFKCGDFADGTSSNKYSTDELVKIGFDWLKEHRVIDAEPSRVCCIDFTFTSHRKDRMRGYHRKGNPRPVKRTQPTGSLASSYALLLLMARCTRGP